MPLGTCKSKVVPLAIEVLQSAAAAVAVGPATALVASLWSADPALPQSQSQSQSKSPSQVRAGL